SALAGTVRRDEPDSHQDGDGDAGQDRTGNPHAAAHARRGQPGLRNLEARAAQPGADSMSDRVVPIVIVGARGRMGKTLIRTVMESESMTLVGAVERTGAPGMGEDAGRSVGLPEAGVPITDRLDPPRGSVVVDFSL